jgi:hypothetical protein
MPVFVPLKPRTAFRSPLTAMAKGRPAIGLRKPGGEFVQLLGSTTSAVNFFWPIVALARRSLVVAGLPDGGSPFRERLAVACPRVQGFCIRARVQSRARREPDQHWRPLGIL